MFDPPADFLLLTVSDIDDFHPEIILFSRHQEKGIEVESLALKSIGQFLSQLFPRAKHSQRLRVDRTCVDRNVVELRQQPLRASQIVAEGGASGPVGPTQAAARQPDEIQKIELKPRVDPALHPPAFRIFEAMTPIVVRIVFGR